MTDEELKTHIGCLINVNCQLYWYKINCWDGPRERLWVLLDNVVLVKDHDAVSLNVIKGPEAAKSTIFVETAAASSGAEGAAMVFSLQLLIDGEPKWIHLTEHDFEIVK